MTEEEQAQEDYLSLVDQAQIGDEAKVFLKTKFGAYIYDRAQKDEISVLRKLAAADITDTVLLTRLQIDAKVPRRLLQYVEQAIRLGGLAEFALETTD